MVRPSLALALPCKGKSRVFSSWWNRSFLVLSLVVSREIIIFCFCAFQNVSARSFNNSVEPKNLRGSHIFTFLRFQKQTICIFFLEFVLKLSLQLLLSLPLKWFNWIWDTDSETVYFVKQFFPFSFCSNCYVYTEERKVKIMPRESLLEATTNFWSKGRTIEIKAEHHYRIFLLSRNH